MMPRIVQYLRRKLYSRTVRKLNTAIAQARTVDLAQLRVLRAQARQIARPAAEICRIAEGRLALPRLGSNTMQIPPQSDWAFRPELWRHPINPHGIAGAPSRTALGAAATLHHDCVTSEIVMRQIRNNRAGDLAPFGLRVEVFAFDGSFMSLALDLPDAASQGLSGHHILRVDAEVEPDPGRVMTARLNVKYGPNAEHIVRDLPLGDRKVMAEFDLALTGLGAEKADRLWLDLIFNAPAMAEITLCDLTVSRRPRADY